MEAPTRVLKFAAGLVLACALVGAASPRQDGAARDQRRIKDIQRIAVQAAAFQAVRKQPPESLQDVALIGHLPLKDPMGRPYEFQLDHYDPELDVIVTVCTAFDGAPKRPVHIDVAGHGYTLTHGAGRHCFSFNIYPEVPGGDHHH